MEQDAKSPTKKSATKQSLVNLALAVCILACFVGIGLTSYMSLYRARLQTSAMLLISNKQHEEYYKELIKQNEEHYNELKDQLTQKISALHEKIQSNASDKTVLIKARYTLELAQINAYATTDYETTLSLLNTADEILSTDNNPAIFPIRQAIAQEISEQEAAHKIDVMGLLSQLNAIETAAKIINTSIQSPQEPEDQSASRVKNLFRQLIIIRHHEQPIEPLQSPAYKAILQEAVQLNLQEAKWAVIQKNDAIYQLALSEAIHNLNQMAGDPALIKTLDMLKLVQLEQQKIIPKSSLTLLIDIMNTSQGVITQ